MNWLNINLTTLRSPAYLGSTPVQQATWLKLLAYCADQENGGRIAGAAAWKARQWIQICGVTAGEVRSAALLIFAEGADICVAFYPLDKQIEVQGKRIAGTEAANRRWHGRLNGGGEEGAGDDAGAVISDHAPHAAHSVERAPVSVTADGSPIDLPINSAMELPDNSSTTSPNGSFCGSANAEGERNGKEVQGKGMYASPAGDAVPWADAVPAGHGESRGRLCSMRAAILHGMRLEPPCPEQWASKWWEDCEKRGWVDNHGIALRQWQPALSSYWRGVQEQDRRSDAAQEKSAATRASSPGEVNIRLKAIDDELYRLRLGAADARSPDGLRTIKRYTPEEETRRNELLASKETLKRKLTGVG